MMKKIIKDTLSLVAITLVAGICLAFVHGLTEDTIKQAEADERAASYREVFPQASDFVGVKELGAADYNAAPIDGVTIGEALYAIGADGNPIGCVISSTSANGYGGAITLSVGIDPNGVITGMKVTSMSETTGFGAHCQDEDFQEQFKGLTYEVTYVAGGKTQPNEIDMISGATFTSRAVTEAVNGALICAKELIGGDVG